VRIEPAQAIWTVLRFDARAERSVDRLERIVAALPAVGGGRVRGSTLGVETPPLGRTSDGRELGAHLQLSEIHDPGRSSCVSLTGGFTPSAAAVLSYSLEAAPALVEGLRPRSATVGLRLAAEKPEHLLTSPVPRVWGLWTYVALDGVPAALASRLRALPAPIVRDLADGIAVQSVLDPMRAHAPSQALLDAIAALPLGPPARYHAVRFPAPKRPSSSTPW
jgi:hypothetical protein